MRTHSVTWGYGALCAQTDPELFFPEKSRDNAPAKRVCRRCPVREECRADALARHDCSPGVLGGLSLVERRRMTSP